MSLFKRRVKIGLALGGGVARSIAHVGIFKILEKEKIPIDCMAGCSGGSLAGALYASGVSVEDLEHLALTLTWRHIANLALPNRGFISNKRMLRFLEKNCLKSRFEDLRIPFSVVATDLMTGEEVIFDRGELFPAIQASCSIPAIFRPVKIQGRHYIDGGFVSQIPVRAVRKMGADLVIACDVNYNEIRNGEPTNLVTLIFHLLSTVSRKNALESRQQADVVISVDAHGIGLAELHRGKEIIARGEEATRQILPILKQEISKRESLVSHTLSKLCHL